MANGDSSSTLSMASSSSITIEMSSTLTTEPSSCRPASATLRRLPHVYDCPEPLRNMVLTPPPSPNAEIGSIVTREALALDSPPQDLSATSGLCASQPYLSIHWSPVDRDDPDSSSSRAALGAATEPPLRRSGTAPDWEPSPSSRSKCCLLL
jgi:hypothetical protein